jgi:hypothetical protein
MEPTILATRLVRREIVRRGALVAAAALVAGAIAAQAQSPPQAPPGPQPPASPNPVCARLEGQLSAFDRGVTDAPRLEQLKKLEDTANKQQFEIDRLAGQLQRAGCEGSGFFLFGGQPPQCEPLNVQMQKARSALDRTQSDMEALRRQGGDREGLRRQILVALAQNDCGPQYRAAAQAAQPRGFFEQLFGGLPPIFGNRDNPVITPPSNEPIPGLPGPMESGAYRTLCVRTCDGYYFPISYSATQAKFIDDEKVCQRQCPAAEVSLYYHRNPGEDVNQAVSMSGQPYTALPTAFLYRKEYNPACSCRRPGESWAQALKNVDSRSTIESGDILVDDQRARQLSMPKTDAQGRPIKFDSRASKTDPKAAAGAPAPAADTTSAASAPVKPDPNRKVRSVGPTFLPER